MRIRQKMHWLYFLLFLVFSALVFVSCVTESNEPTNQTPEKLKTPEVTIVGDVVSWAADSNAIRFEISINGELFYLENSLTSKILTNGQVFKIRAIGDGNTYADSDWSNSATIRYTVVFQDYDGTVLKTEEVNNGSDATPPSPPTRELHEFIGWNGTYVNVQADQTITAHYQARKLRTPEVTFLGNVASWDADSNAIRFEISINGALSYLENSQTSQVLTDWQVFQIRAIGDGITYADSDWSSPAYYDDEVDTSAKFSVTFKYVDPNGQPMAELREGKTEKTQGNIRYGNDAKNTILNDPQAFADYVIIGWDSDGDKKADEGYKSVKKNMTVTSVVRDKYTYNVTFQNEDGTTFKTVPMKEGSAIDDTLETPSVFGKYFKAWKILENLANGEKTNSRLSCIIDDCIFKAVHEETDGTIGKVAPGAIELDGVRDAEYNTHGAYLPLNTQRQADGDGPDGAFDIETEDNQGWFTHSERAVPQVRADAFLVWDGAYIYLIVEVSDTTLTIRNPSYLAGGLDAWLNDGVELWYSFEQDAKLERNKTRVGLDATGGNKYALPRSAGIGGGRSTHYDKIEVAARCTLAGASGSDLSWNGQDAQGNRLPSYILEYKIPARTEGKADTSRGADEKTGLLPGKLESSNKAEDYAFTEGEALVAGNFVRFNLQINDLLIAQGEMDGTIGDAFFDYDPKDDEATEKVIKDLGGYDPAKHGIMLFAMDKQTGKLTGIADYYNKFSAAGNTQEWTDKYIMYSLSPDENRESKIMGLGYDKTTRETVFYGDKECTQVVKKVEHK